QLVNLHYPLHSFTDNRGLVRWEVCAIVGALGLAFIGADLAARKRRADPADRLADLACLSMAGVVSLIAVYHRCYDAVVLIWPLALGIRVLADEGRRAAAVALLALIALFLAPGASI